jgi:hypothetical protein
MPDQNAQFDGQCLDCGGHQDLPIFEGRPKFVVEPSYRFHVSLLDQEALNSSARMMFT